MTDPKLIAHESNCPALCQSDRVMGLHYGHVSHACACACRGAERLADLAEIIAAALAEREREALEWARETCAFSFFAALKPLHLPAINVSDPGAHVTDLIASLARKNAALLAAADALRIEAYCVRWSEEHTEEMLEKSNAAREAAK